MQLNLTRPAIQIINSVPSTFMSKVVLLEFLFPRCWTCHGCGQVECQLCHMRGQLKCYIKLTVAWKTHKNDHIVERTALPDHLIRGAQGQEAFKDQRPRVAPVTTFPEQSVNDASQRLVSTHSAAFPNERILMQVAI